MTSRTSLKLNGNPESRPTAGGLTHLVVFEFAEIFRVYKITGFLKLEYFLRTFELGGTRIFNAIWTRVRTGFTLRHQSSLKFQKLQNENFLESTQLEIR